MPKELRIVYHFRDKISREVRKKLGVYPGAVYGDAVGAAMGFILEQCEHPKKPRVG